MSLLREELSEQHFNTWLRPLKVNEVDDGCLQVLAPNRYILDWVNSKYMSRVKELLQEVSGSYAPEIRLEVQGKQQSAVLSGSLGSSAGQSDYAVNNASSSRPLAPPLPSASAVGHQGMHSTPAFEGSARHSSSLRLVGTRQQGHEKLANIDGGIKHESYLVRNYTFDSFIEGKSNQMARAAAYQVTENPGGSYNPLFIHGDVGLGKTHLMHAVGNALLKKNPNARILYINSERFVADMVKALQLGAMPEFKRYYRSVDALLIDDIQFFAGKDRTEEEFFHTFNALLEGGQQMIFTSDRFPKEIKGMSDRLRTRFGWGLTVSVDPPELETRVAILMKKAEQSKMVLDRDCAFFIAQRIRSNVRDLEGALKKVIAQAHFTGREIDMPLIRESLKDLLALQDKLVNLDNIQQTTAEYYKIKKSDLLSKRRNRSVARPRQVAMALAKELTNHSLPEIGESFGGRDHTTVLHACRKIAALKETDIDIQEDYQNLIRLLTT